jgi:hypothetical protein
MSNATLSEAVNQIERQATRKENAENIDEKIEAARERASNLNGDVNDLADAVGNLQFYRRVLLESFEDDLLDSTFGQPEPVSVIPALEEAEEAVQYDQEEIVDRLIESTGPKGSTPVDEVRRDVTGAKTSVDDAIEDVKDRLRTCENEWEDRIERAHQLQEIVGEIDESFSGTLDWMERLIKKDMWDTTKSASTVVNEWHNARNQWEEHQDLQGLDSFQRTHGLSDDAIAAVERLSSHSNLTLADVDVGVLEELKQVDQLAEAVDLSI